MTTHRRPQPAEVIAVARIIRKLGENDPEGCNRLAMRLVATLAESGHDVDRRALLHAQIV